MVIELGCQRADTRDLAVDLQRPDRASGRIVHQRRRAGEDARLGVLAQFAAHHLALWRAVEHVGQKVRVAVHDRAKGASYCTGGAYAPQLLGGRG